VSAIRRCVGSQQQVIVGRTNILRLATQCCAGVSLLLKVPNGRQIEPGVAALRESQDPRAIDFEGIDDFRVLLRSQLSVWLRSMENS
jgi:hypothetical protein